MKKLLLKQHSLTKSVVKKDTRAFSVINEEVKGKIRKPEEEAEEKEQLLLQIKLKNIFLLFQ